MALTYTAIQTTTLTGNASTITFNSIPTIYQNLVLYVSARTDRASWIDYLRCRFNGDTGANYESYRYIAYSTVRGEATYEGGLTSMLTGYCGAANGQSGMFGNSEIWIIDYQATKRKYIIAEGRITDTGTNRELGMLNSRWNTTSAITSITLLPQIGSNFVSGTTATLYGLRNV